MAEEEQKAEPEEGPPHEKEGAPLAEPKKGLRKNPAITISQVLLGIVVLAGIITLVLWLVYRPHKPRFYVEEASISRLNVSNGVLSGSMQFTVISANPNKKISLVYQSLVTFVVWNDEPITPVVIVGENIRQPKHSIMVFNLDLSGDIPLGFPYSSIDEFLMSQKQQEKEEVGYGVAELQLLLHSRLRFSNAFWRTHGYRLGVVCNLLLAFRRPIQNGSANLLRGRSCHVHL
eukprot:TRINITY_DN3997_c0_g1_i1.p1 TRINITY_DN3997_c0_g1~~TRINITY_DN3997_c0_g1_i1.p1  ORF type:complete len:242 (-),score=33.66 TRINITY_DN3997_c0_g1_i1:429-1124(-)